jgi:hypothetical protein
VADPPLAVCDPGRPADLLFFADRRTRRQQVSQSVAELVALVEAGAYFHHGNIILPTAD